MIIENQTAVTQAVIEAFSGTADVRLRQILLSLVGHLHDFVREVRLTEQEFQEATRIIAAIGQKTTPWHNEVVLMAGSLGVSALVCLLNNGANGQTETQANLLGPFWREEQPFSRAGLRCCARQLQVRGCWCTRALWTAKDTRDRKSVV